MAQRIVTICDAHTKRDAGDAPGSEWTVSITAPGAKAASYVVDLCEEDAEPLRGLLAFLADVGRREGQQPRKIAAKSSPGRSSVSASADPNRWACPVDGCGKVPSSRTALQSHLRSYHDGMTLARAFGEPEPHTCPECGSTFSHPQGLGAHRKSVHGVEGTAKPH